MRIRALQAVVAFLAITLATMTIGLGTAGADGHDDHYDSYGSAAPVAAAPAAPAPNVSSTGHLAVAGNGFASIANGNTAGATSGQATAITPLSGSGTVAATAAPSALAHTGSETYLAYAGLGLIAAGAVAMGSRRRSTNS